MDKKEYKQTELKTTHNKWTKEELDGRVLVWCKANRDGLEPFIDKKKPFDSMSDAHRFYSEKFFSMTENEGVRLRAETITPKYLGFDIIFFSNREKCGEMVIRVEDVV